MSIYDFKVNHLLEDELDYELKIRGTASSRNVTDKRKILTRLLGREKNSPGSGIDLNAYDNPLDKEKEAIAITLGSIQNLVDGFEGSANDSVFHRVNSRLNHVRGRIQRIVQLAAPEETTSAREYVQEYSGECLKLESDLFEKLVEPQPEPETATSTPVINVAAPIVHCTTRNLPISEWQVSFNGDSRKLYPFLERLTELAKARNVSESDLFNSAAEFFTGDAFVWYRSIKDSVADWQSLISKLKKDFLHDDIDDDLWDQIKRRKQRKGESIVIFIAHLEALFSRLSRPAAESSKIKYIRKNLLPEFYDRLALQDITTISQLCDLCRKLEESDYLKEKSKPRELASLDSTQPSSSGLNRNNPNYKNQNKKKIFSKQKNKDLDSVPNNTVSRNLNSVSVSDDRKSKSQLLCWNCRQPNHTYRDCRAPKSIFCFKCGAAKVKSVDCPNCSKNE